MISEAILSALIGAAVASVTNYFLGSRRDANSKRLELVVQNLVAAYEAFDASDLKNPKEEMLGIERAIANVQLFGSEELVALVKAFHDDLKAHQQPDLDPVMKQIRSEIRKALGLPPLTSGFMVLRFSELARQRKHTG